MKGLTKDESLLPMIVCAPLTEPLQYADNLVERCKFCDQLVQLRPHNPTPHLAACLSCWLERVTPVDTILVSDTTLGEIALERAPTKGKH